MSIPLESSTILMIIVIIDDTDSWFHNGLVLKPKCSLSEMYMTASERRQDRMKCQDNSDRRKYQGKPEDILRRHSFNQSRKL